MVLESRAAATWKCLRGLVCVYKPADIKLEQVRHTILTKLTSELNEMECRPPVDHVLIQGDPMKPLQVVVEPSLADSPLVVGPRYQIDDFVCSWSNYLGFHTSGVLLFGIRSGTKLAKILRENKSVRTYHVKGKLGEATDNCYKDGKVVERSTFQHVKQANMNKLLSAMQAAHQKKMFELCGIDMQSQTAYELAAQGPIRPLNSNIPVVYGIKCVEFNLPDFTIEIHTINEYEMYFKALIHEIGMKMRSTAHCTGIQCIRHACFTLDHALLRKHWTLQYILTNVGVCTRLLEEHSYVCKQKSAALV